MEDLIWGAAAKIVTHYLFVEGLIGLTLSMGFVGRMMQDGLKKRPKYFEGETLYMTKFWEN